MAFPEEIKTRAMVACGRCCCLCHKFCGNNMEVHHIKARADGGADTFDNAIPLCFDCHAEVRQYDPKHPKGIRFTEKELIQHRDSWYKNVADGAQSGIKGKKETPLKLFRQEGFENILLHKVSTGQEMLAFIDGCSAMRSTYAEPQTLEEATVISNFVQVVSEQLNCWDIYEPGDRVMLAFSLNESIKTLEDAGFWAFMAKENQLLTGGTKTEPEPFITLLFKIVRKDSNEIIKEEST